jgi:tetratricopeptide (TPR) repeat protein
MVLRDIPAVSRRKLAISRCLGVFFALLFLSSCQSELIRRQEDLIRQQREEIMKTRQEIEEIKRAQIQQEERRRACNRAFREFEQGRIASDDEAAINFYREGLKLCPDDDVARYELGRILQKRGRLAEAEAEFRGALKINPGFHEARRQLEAVLGKQIDVQEIR